VGLGAIAGRQACFNEPAVAAMIAPWPQNAFQVYDGVPPKPFAADTFGMTTAIVHVDPRNRQFDDLLKSLASASQAYLLGGRTASRTKLSDSMAGTRAKAAVCGLFLRRLCRADRRTASARPRCGPRRQCPLGSNPGADCAGRALRVVLRARAEHVRISQRGGGDHTVGTGDIPMIGYYANGEIAGDRIYGYTGVLALF
jgi:hypothetical protein